MRTLRQQQARVEREANRAHDALQAQQQQTARSLDARRARCLQLADERGGGMWAMHFMEAECDPFIGELLRLVAEVDSAHTTERRYHTQYVAALDMAFCDCPAGLLAHACWHAGQSIAYGRSAAEAYSPAGCAASRQENYRNWLDGDTTVDVACDC